MKKFSISKIAALLTCAVITFGLFSCKNPITESSGYNVTYADGVEDVEIEIPADSKTYYYNDTVTVLFEGIGARSGYTFAGWSDGNTTYTQNGTNAFKMGDTNITLTAQWTPVTEAAYNAAQTPLTLEAINAGTITLTNPWPTFKYKKNGGEFQTVTTTQNNNIGSITVAAGDIITMYADGSANDISNDIAFTIVCSEDCYVYGNIMSLQSSTNFADLTNITENWAFAGLFSDIYNGGNNKIRNHSEKALLLPATTLSENCYRYIFKKCTELTSTPALPATSLTSYCYMEMFRGCTSLTTTTQLPATTLASHCYDGMFNGCTSLTIAPALPATSLTESCYDYMFKDCTSLTSAPELPATELATNCYSGMFIGCTGITNAPELPATTLAQGCYNLMFSNCTGLTSAPDLIAPTLVNTCYRMMFQNCSSLTYVKCLATNISAQNATEEWLSGTATSGTRTFVKANGADWSSVSGTSGIPSGWTTQTAEPEYSITLPGNITGGSVTKSPSSNTVTAGTSVTLTASPSTGYQLGSITVTKTSGGTVTTSGTGNSRTFSMPAENVTVSASFTQINYTVSVGTFSNGSINASKTSNAHYGESITLTVNPSAGYQLSTLTYTVAGGSPVSISGTGNSRTFSMPAGNVTINASFTPETYTIGKGTMSHGDVTVATSAAYDSTVTLTITPDTGYELGSISASTSSSAINLSGSGITSGSTRTFTMPAGNVTISATFNLIEATTKPSVTAVGDIVLSNGSVVSLNQANRMSQAQKDMAVAIIFDATTKKGFGKTTGSFMWCTDDANFYNYSDNNQYAISNTDGALNTQQLKDNSGDWDKYPAARNAFNYGDTNVFPGHIVGNYTSGWYLPAIEELHTLFTNITSVNAAYQVLGGSISGWYWSSTQVNVNGSQSAKAFKTSTQEELNPYKTGQNNVISVRVFN